MLERELAAMLRRIEKALKPVMASRDLIALRKASRSAPAKSDDGQAGAAAAGLGPQPFRLPAFVFESVLGEQPHDFPGGAGAPDRDARLDAPVRDRTAPKHQVGQRRCRRWAGQAGPDRASQSPSEPSKASHSHMVLVIFVS